MNPEFVDLVRELCAASARFLVVGAYAVSFHSRPRATGRIGEVECPFIGRDALIRNQRALGRPVEPREIGDAPEIPHLEDPDDRSSGFA